MQELHGGVQVRAARRDTITGVRRIIAVVAAVAAVALAVFPGPAGAATRPTFAGELDRLAASGLIDQATHDRDGAALLDARRALRRLHATPHVELAAVLANLERIAAAGQLTPSRLPALVLTLSRNRSWWTSGAPLADGQRIGFPGSGLVWQYYRGQGIEIQWLATFGKANAYFAQGGAHDAELTGLLDEAVSLAAQRAGGIAWEYEFSFDGGTPPWVSGLAQGTAIQALARAAVRLARPVYLDAARRGLGIFATPPPEGVRVATPAGADYLIYSFAPTEHVLNAFIQSLVGLHDYAALTNDDVGRGLFAAGEAQARLELPGYDTGSWSLYDQAVESSLSYHVLLRDFLRNLCGRLQAPAQAAPPPPTPPEVSGGTAPRLTRQAADTGGTPAAPIPVPGPPAPPQPLPAPAPPSPDVYCAAAARFTAELREAPTINLGRPTRIGPVVRLPILLSKVSVLTLSARLHGHIVDRMALQIGHGARTITWRPRASGSYELTLTATDLAGNAGGPARETVVYKRAPAR